jgi:hypothetical protein
MVLAIMQYELYEPLDWGWPQPFMMIMTIPSTLYNAGMFPSETPSRPELPWSFGNERAVQRCELPRTINDS